MCNAAPQSEYLTVALAAAARAADISRAYYRGNLTVTTKADRTPVTEADIECEEAIRTIILDAFPGHGFYGEETGQTRADADFLWLVDPIDGTKGFVRQYPFFSTQIALMRNGELILGVSSGTMFDELAWAEKGRGAWLNGEALQVSDVSDADRAACLEGAAAPPRFETRASVEFALWYPEIADHGQPRTGRVCSSEKWCPEPDSNRHGHAAEGF